MTQRICSKNIFWLNNILVKKILVQKILVWKIFVSQKNVWYGKMFRSWKFVRSEKQYVWKVSKFCLKIFSVIKKMSVQKYPLVKKMWSQKNVGPKKSCLNKKFCLKKIFGKTFLKCLSENDFSAEKNCWSEIFFWMVTILGMVPFLPQHLGWSYMCK